MSRFASRKEEIAGRFSKAAAAYAAHAALQAAIADALLSVMQPAGVVLDAGCGRGRESEILGKNPNVTQVWALDMATAMLAAVPVSGRVQTLQADMEALPLPDASVDSVFSNFALQWCESRDNVAAEMARVLRPNASFFFSVPGPESLAALRATGLLQVNHFASAQDWVIALMQAGFSDCDIVQKDFVTHFADAHELLTALKGIGANTADAPRENHLHGREWWRQVNAALEAQREPEGLPLRYDVIFITARRADE
jgi:malonyl-CoA O-methyltransferase